jgi:putative FmdB family regulatory protein
MSVPVYVYRRRDGSTFEARQPMAEDVLVECPTTGQSVERVLQPFTPHYKGTGFYSTDHRSAKTSGSRSAESTAAAPRGAGDRSQLRGDSERREVTAVTPDR